MEVFSRCFAIHSIKLFKGECYTYQRNHRNQRYDYGFDYRHESIASSGGNSEYKTTNSSGSRENRQLGEPVDFSTSTYTKKQSEDVIGENTLWLSK